VLKRLPRDGVPSRLVQLKEIYTHFYKTLVLHIIMIYKYFLALLRYLSDV
jgi:hypothetical protein